MTYDQCIKIVNYLNDNAYGWYTWRRDWTWAEVGFFAAWLGLEEANNARPG